MTNWFLRNSEPMQTATTIPNQREAAVELGISLEKFKALKAEDGFPGGPPYDMSAIRLWLDTREPEQAAPEEPAAPAPVIPPVPEVTQVQAEPVTSDMIALAFPIDMDAEPLMQRMTLSLITPLQQRGFARLYKGAMKSHVQLENGRHVNVAPDLFRFICEQAGRAE